MDSETIRAFVWALGPRGSALYECMSIISVRNVEEMTAARVKSYNELEIAK